MTTIKKRERAVLGTVSFMRPMVTDTNTGTKGLNKKETSPKSRREQVLKAQRGHRQRSKDYMDALEKEVLKLRIEAAQFRKEGQRNGEAASHWKDCLAAVIGPPRPQSLTTSNLIMLRAPGHFIWAVEKTARASAALLPIQAESELSNMAQMPIHALQMGIPRPIDTYRGLEVRLLHHFCQFVMPSLEITESSNYGYAQHVIPLAMNNQMVRHAILAASAGHLEITQASKVPLGALEYRSAAISGLREASHHSPSDPLSRLSILATILGLLVDDMISGHQDFQTLIGLANSWDQLSLPLGSTSSEVDSREFLQDQIQVMRTLIHPIYHFQTSLQTGEGSDPGSRTKKISEIFVKIDTATTLACEIHSLASTRIFEQGVDETTAENALKRLDDLLDGLRTIVSSIPPFSLGENGLVWVCSIAASTSQKEHHKAFFASHLAQLLRRTGHPDIKGVLSSMNVL
ncbi:unnamed protein product [Clonostachys rhizophaga]|uniref:Uncharacterized protein n=1 Tax=Clonostachys rhizophaga TaxID=160324 RepID=A0A9N9VJQ6_9HYPO|nr:unnamed protein product [Clonostachys rhizophaga]